MLINGFSKLSKEEKVTWLLENFSKNSTKAKEIIEQYVNPSEELQHLHDEFSENTLTNFYLPWGIAPNFLINGKSYALPMVTEESSVVAAASNMAKFWSKRGGFKTSVLSKEKIGHIHFLYKGEKSNLEKEISENLNPLFLEETASITENMRKRGGGILSIHLIDKTHKLEDYFQLEVKFNTQDAMGANFINSCLEQIAKTFKNHWSTHFPGELENETLQIIMCILSNYNPSCIARAEVSCKIEQIGEINGLDSETFAQKFHQAVQIAKVEPYRAVTHNKGIMNGIDSLVIATGNDFRAVEAGVHAYASKDGSYTSLTHCEIKDGVFKFWIEIPLTLGTVGGITKLHPLCKLSLELLQHPSAEELMQIMAALGLSQNFAALRALVSAGIQRGHMKMHLQNILTTAGATKEEKEIIEKEFQQKTVTHSGVIDALENLRKK